MDWMKIMSAIFIVVMLVFLWPRAGHMLRESRKGSSSEWLVVVLILFGVAGFVAFLMHGISAKPI